MESIYYSLVGISLLYILFKFKGDLLYFLIILCFYSGLAAYLGPSVENPYKVTIFLLPIFLVLKHKPLNSITKRESFIILFFIFFSAIFFISSFLNNSYFNLTFSQYGKYFTPFCLFFLLNFYIKKYPYKIEILNRLIFSLIAIQVFLSVAKYFTFGVQEMVVGSISYTGGGIATPLPIIAFMLLWIYRKGEFSKKDWFFLCLLLFIGFVSWKRAIWFMMPLMVFIFTIYVPRKKLSKNALLILPLIPIIFYLGVRFDPTLNKEHKFWGSFDWDYVLNYTNEYSFGKEQKKYLNEELSVGRGGVTTMLFEKLTNSKSINEKDLYGYGLEEIATRDYDSFDQKKFAVHSKGSVTGVFKTYISFGFLGIIATLLYVLSLIFFIQETRIRYALLLFILWEYLFYIGVMIQSQALAILLFYFILYSNVQKNKGAFLKYSRFKQDSFKHESSNSL